MGTSASIGPNASASANHGEGNGVACAVKFGGYGANNPFTSTMGYAY